LQAAAEGATTTAAAAEAAVGGAAAAPVPLQEQELEVKVMEAVREVRQKLKVRRSDPFRFVCSLRMCSLHMRCTAFHLFVL
jgi:hypothetical protein